MATAAAQARDSCAGLGYAAQAMAPLSHQAHKAIALLAAIAALASCALEPKAVQWERDFYWTERLSMDGQNDLAAKRFAALRRSAVDPRDADEAALLECETQARGDQVAAGAACYDQLGISAVGRPMRVRALLHAGELRYYQLGMREAALKLWKALVVRAPDQPGALRALDHLYLHGDLEAGHREAMVQDLLAFEAAEPASELADNLLLRVAMLLEHDGRPAQLQQAAQLLERHERDHKEDASLVDALMTRARIYRALGNFKLEARDLERMVQTYETSYVFASYAYDAHKPAAARLIELYLGPLHDLARAEFHARNLPEMLRRPLNMPRYLLALAEIQEQRGNRLEALATYQEVLRFITWRNKDFRANDQRICDEEPQDAERQRCHQQLKEWSTDVEPKEAGQARGQIARLEAELRRPDLRQPRTLKQGDGR